MQKVAPVLVQGRFVFLIPLAIWRRRSRLVRRVERCEHPAEIVSVEIKLDFAGLITAFGQACAYKLFSHKSYIVVPASSPQADISRLDSLCMIFGISLIVFDANNPKEPNFRIQTRAARHEPDMFYVNKHIKEVANAFLREATGSCSVRTDLAFSTCASCCRPMTDKRFTCRGAELPSRLRVARSTLASCLCSKRRRRSTRG
jgi:hypothetical protein